MEVVKFLGQKGAVKFANEMRYFNIILQTLPSVAEKRIVPIMKIRWDDARQKWLVNDSFPLPQISPSPSIIGINQIMIKINANCKIDAIEVHNSFAQTFYTPFFVFYK